MKLPVDPDTGEIFDPIDDGLEEVEVVLRDKPKMALSDYARKMARKFQTLLGQEIPDPTPMAPPVGFISQPSMMDHVVDLIRSNDLRRLAESQGFETLEESDDFNVADDDEPMSAYEMEEDYEPLSVFLAKAKPYVEAAEKDAADEAAAIAQLKKDRAEATTQPDPSPAP